LGCQNELEAEFLKCENASSKIGGGYMGFPKTIRFEVEAGI
jgi:hypothetical protein